MSITLATWSFQQPGEGGADGEAPPPAGDEEEKPKTDEEPPASTEEEQKPAESEDEGKEEPKKEEGAGEEEKKPEEEQQQVSQSCMSNVTWMVAQFLDSECLSSTVRLLVPVSTGMEIFIFGELCRQGLLVMLNE